MPLAVLYSRALAGINAPQVTVEVHLANGLPRFTIVGLADPEVRESKDRVRAALQTARFEFPSRRITVNLAPADLPKESGRFDLPIAIGILAASGQIPSDKLAHYEFAGELALTGELRPIKGALALAMALRTEQPGRGFILPRQNAEEAAVVPGVSAHSADSLLQVCAALCGREPLQRSSAELTPRSPAYADMADVKGQAHAKRALEVAAAGEHSLLMIGPPGSGKSMLGERLPGICPAMTFDEALQSAALQSISDQGFAFSEWGRRPFRHPHHSASPAAIVGGGSVPRPGEISLAHAGILLLDEIPEFNRRALEMLREPMETGVITLSRAMRKVELPARFQLVAAMNACPCGHLGSPMGLCHCTPDQVARYRNRIFRPPDRPNRHSDRSSARSRPRSYRGGKGRIERRNQDQSGDRPAPAARAPGKAQRPSGRGRNRFALCARRERQDDAQARFRAPRSVGAGLSPDSESGEDHRRLG